MRCACVCSCRFLLTWAACLGERDQLRSAKCSAIRQQILDEFEGIVPRPPPTPDERTFLERVHGDLAALDTELKELDSDDE